MIRWIKRHRGIAAAIAGLGLIAIVAAVVWFEPHKLFIDERVDEALPVVTTTRSPAPATSAPATTAPPVTTIAPAGSSSTAGATTSTTSTTITTMPPTTSTTTIVPSGPVVVHTSELIEVGHAGTGAVVIVELEDGSRVVRFEDLDVSNGPDLVVILSTSDLTADREAYHLGGFIDIGELKGNQGNQNYVIPDGVDLSEYTTVAIWCRRFNYTFNAGTTS